MLLVIHKFLVLRIRVVIVGFTDFIHSEIVKLYYKTWWFDMSVSCLFISLDVFVVVFFFTSKS